MPTRPGFPPPPGYPSGAAPSTFGPAPTGYGAPGYGYGPSGYSAPGYSAPGYSAPGYGAPGYGAPGYGAVPPTPYGTARPPMEKVAVAALIASLPGVLILSIPFGIAGIRRTRQGARRGRRFAIAGLAISLVWIIVVIGIVAFREGRKPDRAADGSVVHQGSIPALDLHNGDCVKMPSVSVGQPQSLNTVTVVPCSTPHNAQVFTTVKSADTSFPGTTRLVQEGARDCALPAQQYLGTSTTSLMLFAAVPDLEAWNHGFRDERCLLVDGAGDVTGQMRDHR